MAVDGRPGDLGQATFNTRFLGVPMLQWWSDLTIWERVFEGRQFQQVIELGTGRGGMSMYLLLQCLQRGVRFATFDHVAPQMGDTPVGKLLILNQYCVTGDLWSAHISGRIRGLMAEPANHPLLLFCDNGNKPREFQEFAPLLQPGDVAAVHDWGNEFTDLDVPESLRSRLAVLLESECAAMGVLTRWWEVIAA